MARGEQLGRQWMILQMLIASTDGKSVLDIAKKASCHSRTVYRDLEALQIAGFPIYTEKKGGKTFWCILENAKKQTPIPFSLSELMALYFGRDMLNVLKNTIFYDSLKSFFDKVKATLPVEYIAFLEQFEQNIKTGQRPYKLYTGVRETLDIINLAIEEQKIIDISYFKMSKNKNTRRKVAPYNIWFFDSTFYLIGFCMNSQEIRIFAFDRIKQIKLTDELFERPVDFSVEEFMRSSFGAFHGEPSKIKIWFAPAAAGYVKEKIWHESQVLTDQDDGSVIFEAEVAETMEIKLWVLRWGANAKVIEPESLKNEIRSEIRSLVNLYDLPKAE